MRRNGLTLVEVLIVLLIFCGLACVLWPTCIGSSRRARERAQCQSNLRQIVLGFRQYSQDSSGQFPSLATSRGWRKAISPYLKDEAVFQCPSEGNDKAPQTSDYWFNARLSELKLESVEKTSQTLLLGDGYSSGDPRTSLSQMPQPWREDEDSPAWRHLGRANYAFADGHVKSIHIRDVTAKPPQNSHITFAVR